MTPLSSTQYNQLEWQEIEPTELDALISNYTVVGTEPIDYPLTDGFIIYLKAAAQPLLVIEIVTGEDGLLQVNKATVSTQI